MASLRVSSRSTTKLPDPVDRTRERNEIPRDGENCIRVLIPFHFRFGPEKYSEWTRTDWGCERGGLTRTHPHEGSVKYSKSISGYLQRWLSLSVCRITPTRFIIFQTCLFLPTPQGVTLSHRGEMERERKPSATRLRASRKILSRQDIYSLP